MQELVRCPCGCGREISHHEAIVMKLGHRAHTSVMSYKISDELDSSIGNRHERRKAVALARKRRNR